MPTVTPSKTTNFQCPDFSLLDVGGSTITLSKYLDNARYQCFLIMFICNHCPYVKSILTDLMADVRVLQSRNCPCIAVCSNDSSSYPEDSFENMKKVSQLNDFSFPYLHDPHQTVAKSLGAVCTPDFFGFNKDKKLEYRGRFSDPKDPSKHELLIAMSKIASEGFAPSVQFPSVGCSIKWKD